MEKSYKRVSHTASWRIWVQNERRGRLIISHIPFNRLSTMVLGFWLVILEAVLRSRRVNFSGIFSVHQRV